MRMLTDWIYRRARRAADSRPPDFVVGGTEGPYLHRWYLLPRNRWLNVYLHQFLRDDDDRALHDHPWFWCSILIRGVYVEHTIAAGGVHRREERFAPSIKVSGPWRAHRIEMWYPHEKTMPWTIFITGPRIRNWCFHCPQRGLVPWQQFTDPNDPGSAGPGCDDMADAARKADT